MPLVLLVLGVLTTLAGLLLVGSGLTLRDGTFNTDVLTPGAIAVVGGLLLIGFDFIVRELRRVERALVARPMPRVARAHDAATEMVAATQTAAAAVPPPIPSFEPQVAASAAAAPVLAAEPPPEETALERLQARRPTMARVENGRLAEAADVTLALREAAGLDEQVVADVRSVATAGRATNGVGAPARVLSRRDSRPRSPVPPTKPKVSVFNTFWPPAPQRGSQSPAPHIAATSPMAEQSVAPVEPVHAPPPLPEALAASAPVSILKSGVVEGMAYTLYSDGSIEAQLPQGTLRFGSISALRSHIENAG